MSSVTTRLALSYLAIIMLMSIGFSWVFYNTSAHALSRQLPPRNTFVRNYDLFGPGQDANDFFRQRIDEGRRDLLGHLIILNLLILAGGAALSYWLARRTLEPIEANMEAQAQFVSDASHELRTPLTALQTMNEVALRKAKVTSPEAKTVFKNNIAEVSKLRQLTDSLLNLAQNDRVAAPLVPVLLPDVVAEALNSVVEPAMAKQISIDDKVPKITVSGDVLSLTQALVTVLDNAIKYSPENSRVNLTAATEGGYALLQVRDEGMGIKAIHMPHIFDRFYRADASRNKQAVAGFGIGLSLAKKIIEQHGGEIIAESTPGKGSLFTFKLPLSQL